MADGVSIGLSDTVTFGDSVCDDIGGSVGSIISSFLHAVKSTINSNIHPAIRK